MFEVAYFWRLDPAVMLALPISQALLYDSHASRLAKLMDPEEKNGR